MAKGPHPTCPIIRGKLRDLKRVVKHMGGRVYRCQDCGAWHWTHPKA